MQHFPGKGQYESFIDFLVNITIQNMQVKLNNFILINKLSK
jgi:hypothetical protein